MGIRHKFTSAKADSSDMSKIQPSHWNDVHDTTDFFVDDETPAGIINGENDIFTLLDSPSPPSSLQLYLNGQLLRQNIAYTLDTNIITFNFDYIPQFGHILWANYRKD